MALKVNSPADLLRSVTDVLGDLPQSWGRPMFDIKGQPTTNPAKGDPLYDGFGKRSMEKFIADFWDEPRDDGTSESIVKGKEYLARDREKAYPPCFAGKFWKPGAVCVSGVWLGSWNEDSEPVMERLPKIAQREVDLLYDLISNILRYEPGERPSAREISSHPWFFMSD